MVAAKFWVCSKQSHKGRRGCRSLTGCSKEAGGRQTHRRGREMDAHWSAIGGLVKCALLWTLCINLSDASAFLVRPLCLPWPTNSVRWAITVATIVPPFGDHSNPWATLAMVLPPLCLLARSILPLQQPWSFKEGTRVVLQQLHRNRTFWVWATTERPNHFSGRSTVARRSQPCVKGALAIVLFLKYIPSIL